jgi:signal transduction histidine kinase
MLEGEDKDDYEMAIRVMLSRTEHLGDFMRSYADVIRVAKPKKNLHDLKAMLESIAALYKPELSKRNLALQWALDANASYMVAIDRLQMEQVLVNVVKNAIEAAEGNGYIKIGTQAQGKHLQLCIEDSGPGIPAEVKANLFTPFFSTKEHGQGIGLTMIQEILVSHGFEFQLDGPEGGPTQFKIWLD